MPAPREMRLLDLCEPLFLRVCETTRLAKGGALLNFAQAQADFKKTLAACRQEAVNEGMRAAWEHIEPPLRCFVDSMIENGAPDLTSDWANARLAAEAPYLISAGETAFFATYLTPDLSAGRDGRTDQNEQYLEVYYACLQLGFTGMYRRNPQQLAGIKVQVEQGVPTLLNRTARAKITPQAYEHTIVKRLDLDTRPAFWGVLVLTVFFLVVFFWFVGWNFNQSTKKLDAAVSAILSGH